ncbi:antibiotic biosynthesis monooxygenase family protein [Paenibacillus dendritiformis]|uniref:Antibiotic biosynthesis monooxygenase n=1 Tax=Paenibacillus dendritiformis C454 TaxID=1131935 RepID=H3SNI5_9BACL|nr:antibiotic biosynthesis monooxygenase [Paenibacillus dendritiformis]EHQ59348.1 Antibiotic biosynthesis monooxygenase [Paenibacillus dendritiformis C454]PZM65196.1 antibiotic biosynthesis monooxygenase [Paenibacillus dendritiformis]CAH8770173.1 antibiotic biosynthesis monooxygenase [Paenibacillus dendritiformis]
MIVHMTTFYVKPGTANDFESSFREASAILSERPGYLKHELHKCVEVEDKYIMIVQWNSFKDHMPGFTASESYLEWSILLQPFFERPPVSEHYVGIRVK